MFKKIYWDVEDSFNFPSDKIKKKLFLIKKKNRKLYCDWIGKISKKNLTDLDWWLTIPASRNFYQSKLFNYICVLELLELYKKKNFKIIILTSSNNFYNLIRSRFKQIKVLKKKNNNKSNIAFFFKSVFFYIFIFLFIKFFKKKKVISTREKIILMESYVLFNFKESVNLNNKILKINKKNLYFVPTCLMQKNIFNVLKILKNLDYKKKYIFKEHYLKLSDLFKSILHIYRKKKFLTQYPYFTKWNLTSIINEEILSNENYYSAVMGYLNFKFFERIKRKNFNIAKTINLFENQAVGRGWNFGSRKYFPLIENIGYQSYPNFYSFINSVPCAFEEEAKILPKKILVSGNMFKKGKKEFFKKIKVFQGPSFNQQLKISKYNYRSDNQIVLALTGMKKIDFNILSWIIKFLKKNKKIKFIIKFHPILPSNYFRIFNFDRFKQNIEISNDDLDSLFRKHSIVISPTLTSAIHLAFIRHCFLIVPIFDVWDKLDIISAKIPKNNYVMMNNYYNFEIYLKNFNKIKNKIKIKKFQTNVFFEKISKKNSKFFL